MRIAILDDEQSQIDVYKDRFFDLQHEVSFVTSEKELLESGIDRFDIIIIDHSLINMPGEEVIHRNFHKTNAKFALVSTFKKSIFTNENIKDKRISGIFCKFKNNDYNFDEIIDWINMQESMFDTKSNLLQWVSKEGELRYGS